MVGVDALFKVFKPFIPILVCLNREEYHPPCAVNRITALRNVLSLSYVLLRIIRTVLLWVERSLLPELFTQQGCQFYLKCTNFNKTC